MYPQSAALPICTCTMKATTALDIDRWSHTFATCDRIVSGFLTRNLFSCGFVIRSSKNLPPHLSSNSLVSSGAPGSIDIFSTTAYLLPSFKFVDSELSECYSNARRINNNRRAPRVLVDIGKIMKGEERRLGISYDLSNLEEGGTR